MARNEQKPYQFLKSASRFVLVILSALACATIVSAQEPPQGQAPPASQPTAQEGNGTVENHGQTEILQHRNRRYQLHSADVLSLEFPFTPEFNQTVTVQPDGYITLRGIDNMRVVGPTLPEVTTALRTAYSRILHDPVINVELKDFEKPFFIVGGEVGRPGKFELREDTTATEAVPVRPAF